MPIWLITPCSLPVARTTGRLMALLVKDLWRSPFALATLAAVSSIVLVSAGVLHGTRPPHFSAHVDFLKDEVFEICGALALGEGVLDRLGLHYEASQLAAVFAVVEGRLVERLPPYDGVAPGSCSNVSDRELTQ